VTPMKKTRIRGRVGWLAASASAVAMAAAITVPGASAHAAPARTAGTDRLAASAKPAATGTGYVAPKRTLQYGDSGADVLALQRRLYGMHYWLKINGRFDFDTQEAVYAFQGINGLAIDGVVGPKTVKALEHPRAWKAHNPGHSTRIEVDINPKVQALVLYKNNQVYLISHISSAGGYYYCDPGGGGCGYAVTPQGTYTANIFMPGNVTVPLGYMYNPVFFIGTAYAIHGEGSVPNYPASHGCIRIPDDIANFFYKLIDVRNIDGGSGTKIYVYSYSE
jgi:peptidoglycan hydrolase-like protein with peptidoglycan-binding domain